MEVRGVGGNGGERMEVRGVMEVREGGGGGNGGERKGVMEVREEG